MNGIFGFAIYDVDKDEYFVARDHMGIIPLYMVGINTELLCGFRTESIRRILYKIQLFPPGHYMTSKDGEFVQWYKENGLIMMLKTTKQVYLLLKKRWKQLFTGN
jgi:asparagine synthase (glutamine-hydrolysing)